MDHHQQSVPTDLAKKFDAGKLPYHLIPWDAMDKIVAVLDYGARKYGARNWEQEGHWHRNFSALMRHSTKWFMGEDLDTESGHHHLAHAGCCLLFMLAYTIRKIGVDDRPVKGIPLSEMKVYETIEEARKEAGEHDDRD